MTQPLHVRVGEVGTLTFTVTEDDTAAALGSGDLPVLATPRLLAWVEAATCAAIDAALAADRTSVGTRMQLEHVAASPVGAQVRVHVTVGYVDGRLVRFDAAAVDAQSEKVLGHGEVTRVVVDRDRFLSRLR